MTEDLALEAAARYRYALARGLFKAENPDESWDDLSDDERLWWFEMADQQAELVK